MSARRPAPTAALRGGAVGATVASLAVAAHGVGGGGWPDATGLTLLLAVAVAVGALTGGAPVFARSRWALLAALAGGQAAGHLSLTITSGTHAHDGVPATVMVAAHAVAALVCALLISTAERLHGPITRVLRAVFAPPTPTPPTPSRVPIPWDPHPIRLPVLASGWSRRGPPQVA
ncbi:hypothetical protein [Prescottella subtropica]|uniref:hypothetical protein n=1 Tax=Prescottella subtropica TaxID=2545757 RepID=UPI0010F7BF16|nr:hypothetical protein [Prescottella subtropica]